MAFKGFPAPAMRRFYSSIPALQTSMAGPRRMEMPKEPPRMGNLPNGILVASMENYHPIARVSVLIKAGSRFESGYNLGISHCLRTCAGLSAKTASIFAITRNVQLMGANITTTGTREYIIYTLECNRDKLRDGMKYFFHVVSEQLFKPWEVRQFLPRMHTENAALHQRPNVLVLEALHKVAFRTGLGNSIYTPRYMVGRHDTEMLTHFMRSTFAPNRTAIVGIGMSHETALECANLIRIEGTGAAGDILTKYGGGELRIEKVMPYAHVAIAASGATLRDPKEAMAAAILQYILGGYPQVKRAQTAYRLQKAAASATQNPFAVTSLNINYTDGGLFGFYVVGQGDDMPKLIKSLVAEVSSIRNGISDEEVRIGKQRLKAAALMAIENSTDLAEELGSQLLTNAKITTAEETERLIEGINTNDVNEVAKKITNGKPSMAAVGNLTNTPYLDEIR